MGITARLHAVFGLRAKNDYSIQISLLSPCFPNAMFTPLGLFKDVSCPQGEQCSLLACMFSHRAVDVSFQDPGNAQDQLLEQKEMVEPAPKRIKLDPAAVEKDAEDAVLHGLSSRGRGPALKATPVKKTETPVPKAENTRPVRQEPAISKTAPVKESGSLPPRQAPKETLNPRMLPKSPATYNVRLAILKKLHTTLCSLNDQLTKDKAYKDKCLVLTPDELITMALDEEEKAAKDNPTIYSNIVKLRIVKLSKLSKEYWANELKDYLNKKYYKLKTGPVPKEPEAFTTGLSVDEETAIASKLVTPLQGLEEHGYVTKAPTAEEIETARKGVAGSGGWEKCERCGGRFQVFPGRREDGSLTTGGPCTHHPGKALYPPRKKTDHVTGAREAYFTCCNETLGQSPGCTKVDTHVFKVSESKRLASILQFEHTPENPDKTPKPPVCFDCEMAYTTLGLELIRLTAVTWPQGSKIIDALVRPLGEILDLNSRFSGVFPDTYNNALPYGTPPTPLPTTSNDPQPPILQILPSPSSARTLLFTHLHPSTPLIGHAIDNDLNACRIIHPTVIDTAILFPHPAGKLPYRMSLRTLAKRHLDREIQIDSQGQGHDSLEDALATGDLVRVKCAAVWNVLRVKGWRVEEGRVVEPVRVTQEEADADADVFRVGVGGKRTTASGSKRER
ncbi:hypothetical protein BDW59DRAFT_144454 [Aspergillus cavernicola]|uniref:Exonuclease domain-containing protein n=1 Tax=Aspergillus cavernicola TaxID=176166 RepID=A0ABR4IGT9_9EURO